MNRYILILISCMLPAALNGQLKNVRQPLLDQLQERVALREGRTSSLQYPGKCVFGLVARIRTLGRSLTDEETRMLRLLQTRPTRQTSILSLQGHFRIHFDTTGTNAAALLSGDSAQIPNTARAYADSIAEIFENVWTQEIEVMGYPPPPSDGDTGDDSAYDIYIQDELQTYGETWPDLVLSGNNPTMLSTSFIVIDNDYLGYYSKGLNGARVTAAHEFFHAVQIGNYRLWTEDASSFFYEISSTWMENEVYPAVKDYIQYVPYEFRETDIPLNEANGLVEYGRAIFAKFLERKFGRSIIHDIWETIRTVPSLQAIIQTLLSYHTSLESEYPEYALWHYYTGDRADSTRYFVDGTIYPEVRIFDQIQFIPPRSESNFGSRNLAFQYYQVLSNDTVTLVATNVNLVSALNDAPDIYPFSYLIRSDGGDDSYTHLSNGWWIKLQADDPSNWNSNAFLKLSTIATDVQPYPNPFIADGTRQMVFPVWLPSTDAELSIYSLDFREIFHGRINVGPPKFGKSVVLWNGLTNNGVIAASGIYYYSITVNGETRHGKLAILKK